MKCRDLGRGEIKNNIFVHTAAFYTYNDDFCGSNTCRKQYLCQQQLHYTWNAKFCYLLLLSIIHTLFFREKTWRSRNSRINQLVSAFFGKIWFKTTLQYNIVVILQVLHFQVQMLNWTSCYNPNTRIPFALVVYMISCFTHAL